MPPFSIRHLGTAFVQPGDKKTECSSPRPCGHYEKRRTETWNPKVGSSLHSILPGNLCCFLLSMRGVGDVPKLEPVQLQTKSQISKGGYDPFPWPGPELELPLHTENNTLVKTKDSDI